ncbi:unnamed protein product [Adineta ricciae]|uniref:Uncharacterized protein n=1 Tax=Adineta ricciae TaxID=249248 RepID=A0A815PIU9_ADIRI|nr:unnamed protein product [Adineta ricciae]CAF1619326.1 unnamed protein product [Adineta ricciae]
MATSNENLVGMGYRSPYTVSLPYDSIWAAMVDKVYNTSDYLPVTDVKTIDRSPTHVYREMKAGNKQLNEDIYLDKEKGEIKFFVIDADEVHVNKFHKDEQVFEYYNENKKGERIPWNAPQAIVLKAMDQTVTKAKKLSGHS